MANIKDKVITMESLAMLHAYNQDAYMSKADNVLVLIDLNKTLSAYNPNDFVNFVLEIVDNNNETKQIIFTNKISNNETLDVKSQTSMLDENGDMLLYELYFSLENDKYKVNPMLTKIVLSTGIKTHLPLSYDKLYGAKIINKL